jgi:hypothetical protein
MTTYSNPARAMTNSKLALLAGVAALAGAAALLGRPSALSAQVFRCYDVVCTEGADGVVRCVEKLVPCPPIT